MANTKPYVAPKQKKIIFRKGTLLYLFLVPTFLSVIVTLFQTNIQAFLLNGVSFFLFLGVLTFSKKGFTQEYRYNNETFTQAPKLPYKMISGYLLGLTTLFTAYVVGGQPFNKSIFLALISLLGYYLYYGFDPKKDKLENLGDISATFALETLNEAKTKLSTITDNLQQIKDTLLNQKLKTALVKANEIIQSLQEDPKDIRVARKFLIVYIDGIAKVTDSYTEMDERNIDQKTKDKLSTLLDDIQHKFDEESHRLQNNNKFDLDVHIDVLKEQIK